ncbi:MAG: hypothetical protein KF870_18150 [Leadbetterella sp.]|nr:hypothetical protein [Leadbetterella sp.]
MKIKLFARYAVLTAALFACKKEEPDSPVPTSPDGPTTSGFCHLAALKNEYDYGFSKGVYDTRFEYDAQNRITKITTTDNGVLSYSSVFKYNTDGFLTEMTDMRVIGTVGQDEYTYTLNYQDNRLAKISCKIIRGKGGSYPSEASSTFTYEYASPTGLELKKQTNDNIFLSAWFYTNGVVTDYTLGNSHPETFNASGYPTSSNATTNYPYEYIYNADNQLIKVNYANKTSSPVFTSTTTFEYSNIKNLYYNFDYILSFPRAYHGKDGSVINPSGFKGFPKPHHSISGLGDANPAYLLKKQVVTTSDNNAQGRLVTYDYELNPRGLISKFTRNASGTNIYSTKEVFTLTYAGCN